MSERNAGIGYRLTGLAEGRTRPAGRRTATGSRVEAGVARRDGARRSDTAWRARVDQRLAGVEDAIGDLRTRVNSVLALIGAAVVGQIALRFFGH